MKTVIIIANMNTFQIFKPKLKALNHTATKRNVSAEPVSSGLKKVKCKELRMGILLV